ncbi:uncharacterized protein LOC110722203 [Chenopodium quinoa]|uniref:uncharacterized protein LOC110722203 n=1 Tax=Chenopodium quinoa TaxID=63459 RepID=UPI000B7800D3|nr:uncharacterized protein LOC110722203 [Chenopodium quinoa]
MVPIRLSCFIFMLMFTLLEARDSIFKHHPLYHQAILEAKITRNEIVEAKEIHQTIATKEIKSIPIILEEEGNKMMLNGRKLASKDELKKEKANTKEQAKMAVDSRSSKISGATSSSWKSSCNNKGKKRRKMDVICNQSVRNIPKKKAKFPVGFVALSADYHFPNSHPPRHN